MSIVYNNLAFGGTELMARRMENNINIDLLDNFQIFMSRITEDLDPTKKKIFVAHDLPEDPETHFLLDFLMLNKFSAFVFVSQHQLNRFKFRYPMLPLDKCFVIENAIEPFTETREENKGPLKLIYTSTPHRGLNVLVAVFNELKKNLDIELDVYSSFKLYGWEERDKEFESLFDVCKNSEGINYHGSVSNQEIRDALRKADIFVLPSIWEETSCLCLIEALAADLICVHSSLGALPETAKGHSVMYQYAEDLNKHAGRLFSNLWSTIGQLEEMNVRPGMQTQQSIFFNNYHGIERFKTSWERLLTAIQ